MRTRIRNADLKAIRLAVANGDTVKSTSNLLQIAEESLAPHFTVTKSAKKRVVKKDGGKSD